MDFLLDEVIAALRDGRGAIATAVVLWLAAALYKRLKRQRGARVSPLVSHPDPHGRRGRALIRAGTLFLLAWAVWLEVVGPRLSALFVRADVASLIRKHRWVTYNPRHFNPLSDKDPDREQMAAELKSIRGAGFDGIITFSSAGASAEIPRLAKAEGLAVIMGLWDPNDRAEVAAAAAAQEYVDAYCVGHNGLEYGRYTQGDLLAAMRRLRFKTARPVSTTEKLGRYLDDPRFLLVGDWLFPDFHLPFRHPDGDDLSLDAAEEGRQTIEKANLLARQRERAGRPLLLKMVTYPMRPAFTPEGAEAAYREQAGFFATILKTRRDVTSAVHSEVSLSVHSAFDLGWKTGPPFYKWDPYTGLLEDDGRPRPAVGVLLEKLP